MATVEPAAVVEGSAVTAREQPEPALRDEELVGLAARVPKTAEARDMLRVLRGAVGRRREKQVALRMLERGLIHEKSISNFVEGVFGAAGAGELPPGILVAVLRAQPRKGKSVTGLRLEPYTPFIDAIMMHAECRSPAELSAAEPRLAPNLKAALPWVRRRCGHAERTPSGLFEDVVRMFVRRGRWDLEDPIWTLRDDGLAPMRIETYGAFRELLRLTGGADLSDVAIDDAVEKITKEMLAEPETSVSARRAAPFFLRATATDFAATVAGGRIHDLDGLAALQDQRQGGLDGEIALALALVAQAREHRFTQDAIGLTIVHLRKAERPVPPALIEALTFEPPYGSAAGREYLEALAMLPEAELRAHAVAKIGEERFDAACTLLAAAFDEMLFEQILVAQSKDQNRGVHVNVAFALSLPGARALPALRRAQQAAAKGTSRRLELEMSITWVFETERARRHAIMAPAYDDGITPHHACFRSVVASLPQDRRDRILLEALKRDDYSFDAPRIMAHFDLASDDALDRGLALFLEILAAGPGTRQGTLTSFSGSMDRAVRDSLLALGDRIEAPLAKHLSILAPKARKALLDATSLSNAAYRRIEDAVDQGRPPRTAGEAPDKRESERLERLLTSRDLANVRLAVWLLKTCPLPQELTELAVAAMLFVQDEDVRKALAAVVAIERPKIGDYFHADARLYHEMTNEAKMWKLVRDVELAFLGLDAARFALAIFRIQVNARYDFPEALSLALRFKDNERAAFSYLADRTLVTVWNLKKRLPAGLGQLKRAERLCLIGGTITEPTNFDELGELTALRRLEYLCEPTGDIRFLDPVRSIVEDLTIGDPGCRSGLEDISALAGWSNLKHLNLKHTNVTDISPLAGLEKLESLGLTRAIPAERIASFKKAKPNVKVEVY